MTSPLVKWVGGKTRLLPELVKRLPKRYRTYYEPFFGGGALFFHLEPPRAVVSDMNGSLIAMYESVRLHPGQVARSLGGMARWHSRANYYRVRERWNKGGWSRDRHVQRAAALLYLNRTCFNGLYRENAKGEFNVPMGSYGLGHKICDPERIHAASRALASAVIRWGDYRTSLPRNRSCEGDFIYLDPPYDPVSSTASFTAYSSGGFDRGCQVELADEAQKLVHHGAQVMISNSDTKFIRAIYRDRGFKISKIMAPRSINSDGKKRGKVGELVITGGY